MIKKTLAAMALAGATAVSTTAMTAAPAAADPYPTADVQGGVYARTGPSTGYDPFGTVLGDWPYSNTQRSWVKCYADGGWATGNYRTNRWFLVYLYTTRTGYQARWLYVHASYVYNQPRVGRC